MLDTPSLLQSEKVSFKFQKEFERRMRCFRAIRESPLRGKQKTRFLLILRLKILIQITRNHTVVKLSYLIRAQAVEAFELRVRGNDVDLPR